MDLSLILVVLVLVLVLVASISVASVSITGVLRRIAGFGQVAVYCLEGVVAWNVGKEKC